ncbi:MAG: helix-turn-helix domain-containing protein [Legionellales bacterium]|jgi:SOS-response transcriptional repressor LexA
MNKLTIKKYKKENLSKTLKVLMEHKNINISILSKNTGVPVGTISRLLTDEYTNPTLSSLTPIAEFFDISVGQLIGDAPLSLNEAVGFYVENRNFWTSIPVIPWETIKEFLSSTQQSKNFSEKTILSESDLGQNSYALKVDDSDWDYFSEGTILVIDKNAEPQDRDFIVVFKDTHKAPTLKQLLIDEDGNKYLKPMNSSFKILMMDESYEILGVMKQARKDY